MSAAAGASSVGRVGAGAAATGSGRAGSALGTGLAIDAGCAGARPIARSGTITSAPIAPTQTARRCRLLRRSSHRGPAERTPPHGRRPGGPTHQRNMSARLGRGHRRLVREIVRRCQLGDPFAHFSPAPSSVGDFLIQLAMSAQLMVRFFGVRAREPRRQPREARAGDRAARWREARRSRGGGRPVKSSHKRSPAA